MSEDNPAALDAHKPGKVDLLRDIGLLQLKLIVDGLRDFALVPLSLVAGVISLMSGRKEPGPEFYDLLRYGKRSERWINLFGAIDRLDEPKKTGETEADLDRMMDRIETFVVKEYRDGNLTSQAKEKLDSAIERMQQATRRSNK
ncbi:MAG: hypothetical protein RIA65_07540 [Woeseia sp.]